MQKITEAIRTLCTVVNTLYPILKDLQKKKADQSGNSDRKASQG